jgi:hypothetical protein
VTTSWHRSRIGMSLLCAPNGIEFGIFRMVSTRPEMCARNSSFGRPLPAYSRRLVSLQAVDLFVLCAYDVAAKRRRLPEPRRAAASGLSVRHHLHIVRSDRGHSPAWRPLAACSRAPGAFCISTDPRAPARPWAATGALSSHGHR